MKFNKYFQHEINKYKDTISPQLWFEYKGIKKRIKTILKNYKDIYEKNNQGDDELCIICMEDNKEKKLMKSFCCNYYIHYTCQMKTITKCSCNCPICRKYIIENLSNITNEFDLYNNEILSLLSYIQLNIIKIETVYLKKLIVNERSMKRYRELNYIAIMKICKKIKKYIDIDSLQYFKDIIDEKKILKIQKKHENIFQKLIKYIR